MFHLNLSPVSFVINNKVATKLRLKAGRNEETAILCVGPRVGGPWASEKIIDLFCVSTYKRKITCWHCKWLPMGLGGEQTGMII